MNPAPTLLTDYQTPALVIVVAAAVILYFLTDWLIKRMRRANPAPAEQAPEQAPDPCAGDCGIEECHRPGYIPFRTTNGLLYVCLRHSGRVGDWVGHDNAVYDQDLDPATDLATWDKEMDAS